LPILIEQIRPCGEHPNRFARCARREFFYLDADGGINRKWLEKKEKTMKSRLSNRRSVAGARANFSERGASVAGSLHTSPQFHSVWITRTRAVLGVAFRASHDGLR
jgi:hypothetical protein